jgi:UDP-N-acetylglucosamine 1-carboxyvinyltransferase
VNISEQPMDKGSKPVRREVCVTLNGHADAAPTEERITILGGTPLRGEVEGSGSKNDSLPILAASLLASRGQCVLHNVPHIADVETMCEMLIRLGAKVYREDHTVVIDAQDLTAHTAPENLVRKMRASFYVAAPLLARLHKAEVPLPGGCVLGARPVNYHIDAFKKMGAAITVEHGAMNATAEQWRGADIYLEPKNSSVGATVNIIMAACLAEGTTTIENAAREPEVDNLAVFLNKMGAKVWGAGTSTITIEGVKELHGAEHSIYNDRIEAGTFLAAAAITGGDITVHGLSPLHLPIYLDKLEAAGREVTTGEAWIRVKGHEPLRATDVTTAPFPGFATDLQPLFLTLMCFANGRSVIEENLYDGRFNFVPELMRMGSDITLIDNMAIVRGVPRLSGAEVKSTDLRAGAALVLAGLAAEGRTDVTNVQYIDRGYENFVDKLRSLGGQVTRPTRSLRLRSEMNSTNGSGAWSAVAGL